MAERTASSNIDRADACKAFDAALPWDSAAPIVDAAQGATSLLALLEKSRGYSWRATRSPTSPAALGDGESPTEARIIVARNATMEGMSIGNVRIRRVCRMGVSELQLKQEYEHRTFELVGYALLQFVAVVDVQR